MTTTDFLRPALHPAGKNFSTNGTTFPSINYDALNEAIRGDSGNSNSESTNGRTESFGTNSVAPKQPKYSPQVAAGPRVHGVPPCSAQGKIPDNLRMNYRFFYESSRGCIH
jgi:hypothetical protein